MEEATRVKSGLVVTPCFITEAQAFVERHHRHHMGHRFVGIELNPDYVAMAERRIATEAAIGNTVEVLQDTGREAQLALPLEA